MATQDKLDAAITRRFTARGVLDDACREFEQALAVMQFDGKRLRIDVETLINRYRNAYWKLNDAQYEFESADADLRALRQGNVVNVTNVASGNARVGVQVGPTLTCRWCGKSDGGWMIDQEGIVHRPCQTRQ